MKTPPLRLIIIQTTQKKEQQARKTNDDTPAKRGAKKGHTDTSHKRKPTATIIL